jgi:hypothetical protein
MAQPRTDLQAILEALIGNSNVYFQPPETLQMQFPCIVYQRYIAKSQFADGVPYIYTKRYQVTVIDQDPDSQIPDKVATLPMCIHNRSFAVSNLNHDVFNLYF